VWLLGALGLGAGTTLSVWLSRGGESVVRPGGAGAGPRAPEDTQRGTVEWTIALLSADAETLLADAGDVERVTMRHRREPRLVPVLERILGVAVASSLPDADVAGACAVRSLARLDQGEALARSAAAIMARTDLLLTNEALAEHRARLERRRPGK
jgi:hypothetical protein